MPSEIRRLTSDQFVALLQAVTPGLTRRITGVHLHHTWRPTQSQFRGQATIEAIRHFHVHTNGWDDIAQHLTIDPQGLSWTGRNWNLPPASQPGKNGTRAEGPFMIEMVGDFDAGRDVLEGAQRQAVVDVVAAILDACGLTTDHVFFHRELGSPKTCPGTGLVKDDLLQEIQAARGAVAAAPSRARGKGRKAAGRAEKADRARSSLPFAREFLLRDSVAADVGEPAPNYQSWGVQENDLAAREIEETARSLVRVSMRETRDFATALERTDAKWDPLRPHVINLTKGRLSQGGEFEMPADAIDNIVASIEQYAQAAERPRVMMHAHGGLVSERTALSYAMSAYKWWLDQGVYPIYFIWETSAFEIIKQQLGLSRGIVGDWWDRRFERIARPVGKPLWGAMKESALLSSSSDAGEGDAGGAWKFAQALAPVIKNAPAGKTISLHTVGHSAGAIFHAHYVPALIDRGLTVDSLALLAPAVRIDLFKSHLLPRITDGKVGRLELYTMDEEAEKDDDLIEPLGVPVYGKSLLYLISGAFEPEQDAGILGLEERLKEDPLVMSLFAPQGPHRLEFSHARGKPHNPATKSRKHGCFDNDDATMQSIFTTITGAAAIAEFPASDESCTRASSRAIDWTGSWPTATWVPAAARGGSANRALCVGIDSYPTAPLAGCVRDARAWQSVLAALGFDTTVLLDAEATRQRVLDALGTLVRSAQPGDLLVFQYSGHGTQAEDLNGDEGDRYDEALVPIDYQSGALLLDDDLADVYRQLPAGAVLTLFVDCCHSGTNSRFAPIDRAETRGSERRRFLELTPDLEQAHRAYRARAGSPTPTTPEESLPGIIHYAACLDNQFAYESSAQGHFTRVATADLAAAARNGVTNESFSSDVATKVIALGRPQTPRLMRLPAELSNRPLLGGAAGPGVAPFMADQDRAMAAWCLQFFEAGAAYWRQRAGR
jgi:hypothetical protein